MNDRPVFSPRLLIALVAAALGTLALSLYLMSRDDHGADTLGPSSYSVSALGYAGIADLLGRLGVPVVKSRRQWLSSSRPDGVVIVAEPRISLLEQPAAPISLLADKVLLVLPKWRGASAGERRGWVGRVAPNLIQEAERTLALVLGSAEVKRVDAVTSFTINEIGTPPPLAGLAQLVKSDEMRALVSTSEGILLGEVRKDGRVIWVLSDPDVIANHAFASDGKGTVFAVRLIEALRDGRGAVIFDETSHGFLSQPAMAVRLLFQFPYNILALQIVIGVALLAWATMGRFGPPQMPPSPLLAGKAGLVSNVAHLMAFAGHERLILARYVDTTLRDTARALRVPKDLALSEQIAWLQRLGTIRNVGRDPAEIKQRADRLFRSRRGSELSSFAQVARDIYRWKREILDGPSGNPRHHGGDTRRSPQGGDRPG
jgi:hypothetical protein